MKIAVWGSGSIHEAALRACRRHGIDIVEADDCHVLLLANYIEVARPPESRPRELYEDVRVPLGEMLLDGLLGQVHARRVFALCARRPVRDVRAAAPASSRRREVAVL